MAFEITYQHSCALSAQDKQTSENICIQNRSDLRQLNFFVLKHGSALMLQKRKIAIQNLSRQIAELWDEGRRFVIVSSGAVALGQQVAAAEKPLLLGNQRQAYAALGQMILMNIWRENLKRFRFDVAQLLLTQAETRSQEWFQQFPELINELLHARIIPIFNENDAVATSRVTFNNNDNLSIVLARLLHVPLVVMLSSINGVLTPNSFGTSKPIRYSILPHIDRQLLLQTEQKTPTGVGGMTAKLQAAKIGQRAGISSIIASGFESQVLLKIFNGDDIGTFISGRLPTQSHSSRD